MLINFKNNSRKNENFSILFFVTHIKIKNLP